MKKVLFFGMLLLINGCATYQSMSLGALDPNYVREYEQIEGLLIGSKQFTQEDCQTYLDRNVIKKGYQPIQLTFHNQTDRSYFFSTAGVELPCVRPEVVAKKVHTSTIGRVLGYTVGACFIPPLIIPAIVDGIKSSKTNDRLDEDFSEKGKERLLLTPNSFNKTILFIPKSQLKPVFGLTLVEEKTGKAQTINVHIRHKPLISVKE